MQEDAFKNVNFFIFWKQKLCKEKQPGRKNRSDKRRICFSWYPRAESTACCRTLPPWLSLRSPRHARCRNIHQMFRLRSRPRVRFHPTWNEKRMAATKAAILFWYPRAESNRQRCFRRALLYPFNYEDLLSCESPSREMDGGVLS